MELVIVESPAKSRTLSRFLGSEYKIMASMGHLRDLPKKKLGVDIKNKFRPSYIQVPGKEEVIRSLKETAKKADKIILAMDPDREGEAIAHHIIRILKEGDKYNFTRIVFHEITKEAVLEALGKSRGIDHNLVDSQQARRILDRLVGYELSPLLWRKIRRGLSAGRVQSPALRLIVEREKEIDAFKPEEYWFISTKLKAQSSPACRRGRKLKADLLAKLEKIEDQEAKVKNKKQADAIVEDLKKAHYLILKIRIKRVKRSSPPPFTTSTLQQTASRLFYWSGRKTMREAQRLYEEGLITYHRTDSLNLAASAVKEARLYINSIFGKEYLPEKPKFYKTKSKLAQEAHEAIRVTKVGRSLEVVEQRLDKGAARLYQLILNRFLASQMADQEVQLVTLDIKAKAKKTYILQTKEEAELFKGWRVVYGEAKSLKIKTENLILRNLKEGDKLKLIKVLSEQKFTQPPARYTEGTLVKALEEYGIGRPSTYAPIIFTLQQRQYVEKIEGRLKPTELGIAVNGFLLKFFMTIMDYDFTAEMEDQLDKIAEGEIKKQKILSGFWQPFAKKLKEVSEQAKRVKIKAEKTGRQCPKCKKGEVVIRRGRFGKFLSCSRFPDCDFKESYVEKLKGAKCPQCGAQIVIRYTKRRKRFYGCSNYPKCQWASWGKPRLSG